MTPESANALDSSMMEHNDNVCNHRVRHFRLLSDKNSDNFQDTTQTAPEDLCTSIRWLEIPLAT